MFLQLFDIRGHFPQKKISAVVTLKKEKSKHRQRASGLFDKTDVYTHLGESKNLFDICYMVCMM